MKQFGTGSKLFFLILILLFGSIPLVHANLIVNPGFETGSIGTNWPTGYGYWSGDVSTIVGIEQGITPFGGDQMLRFDATRPDGGSANLTMSNVVQMYDVSGLSDDIDDGLITASLSAYFNRIVGSLDTAFGLKINACPGNVTDYPDGGRVTNAVEIFADALANTWEFVSLDMILPAGTKYLALEVNARENISNDPSNEFLGHYADDVTLTLNVVPIPWTVWLFGSGIIGIVGIRRKFKN